MIKRVESNTPDYNSQNTDLQAELKGIRNLVRREMADQRISKSPPNSDATKAATEIGKNVIKGNN